MPSARLVYAAPVDLAIGAMSNCYGNKCTIKSLLRAVKVGHWSLLEHINCTLDLFCSEAVLKQITRHRHLSPTVESSRGSDITENGTYIHDELVNYPMVGQGEETAYDEMWAAMLNAECAYRDMVKNGVPKEIAAYVLPMGMQVKMRYTGNLRAWMEYLKKRLCKRASIEHRKLAEQIYEQLHEAYPEIVTKENIGVCENCQESSCNFA